MADFIEREAEESEDESFDHNAAIQKSKKRHKFEESDDEDDEEDEEKLRQLQDDLINDEEEDVESDEEIKKRKHEDDELEEDLEEDDYALLEENLGVRLNRKKKLKRVKRVVDAESDEDGADDRDDDKEGIANELFDGEDSSIKQPKRIDQSDDHLGNLSESEESEDEDNFIVDDNDRPISKPRKKKGYKYNDEAMQQAQDVFGVDFDFDEFENFEEADYEDEEEDEEYEDESREGETQKSSKKKSRGRRKSSRKSIFEVYEPSELERSHLTDFDNDVRGTDIPERFQLRNIPVTPATEEEIIEEADWIYKNAFAKPPITMRNEEDVEEDKPESTVIKITETLKFIRNQTLEVPFIAFYRKEYYLDELKINDLWTVYAWDEKWCLLQQKKTNLVSLFKNMQQYQIEQTAIDETVAEKMRVIGDQEIEQVNSLTNFDELKDYWIEFQLYYSSYLPSMKQEILRKERERRLEEITEEDADKALQEEESAINAKLSTLRLAQRKDAYTICREAGIDQIGKHIGLTPEQLGENMDALYSRNEVEQYHEDLNSYLSEYVCSRFPSISAVREAAKFVIARQISGNPLVRKCIRQQFFNNGMVHCKPTKKGIKEIDESHDCFDSKYLRNKKISEFLPQAFLQMSLANTEGLLDMRITIDTEDISSVTDIVPKERYFDDVLPFYQRDEMSLKVKEWNKFREEALEYALEKMLYPAFAKEVRTRIIEEAQEYILRSCRRQIRDWIRIAPYQAEPLIQNDEDFDIRDGTRIMALAYSTAEDTPAFATVIDGDGDVIEHLRLPYFMYKRYGFSTDKEKEFVEKDKNKLKNLIYRRKPHVICIGSESIHARDIVKDIDEMTNDLSNMDRFPLIPIAIINNDLALVYMNSKRAIAEFNDFPPILRQAISLARRMQDPLIEFTQLCTPDDEIACLRYHYLQDHVSKEELLYALNLEFINQVNEVGVDVNRAIVHPHTSQMLQFVCGLGPRKAAALLRNLKKQQTPLLENRTQLVMNCQIGAKVFINCAGFIKIDTDQFSDSGTETYIEVLDGTRVHPEAYEWARKMAVDALEYEDDNDQTPANALDEILENPEKLKDLDLDAFAQELERQSFGEKHKTLYDIRDELHHKYKDMRVPYLTPNSEELFQMLTKETPRTLYNGKLLMGRVVGISYKKPSDEVLDSANPIRSDSTGLWSCPFCRKNDFPELGDVWAHFDGEDCPGQATGIRVRLDNGLVGFIENKKISDNEITDPSERVKIGQTIHCRIEKINAEKYLVDLTCRTSDLLDLNHEHAAPKDHNYDYEMEDYDKKLEEDHKKKHNRQAYIKRIIVHPSFHNIDYKQAERVLKDLDQGEAIIRPSSKGTDHLTLTWKVAESINQHVDIIEEGKDNAFSLGHQLYINGEAYEDLDEIIARYVHPMASHARDILTFKYFKIAEGGKREEMEAILMDEKKKHPNKIHYFISASKEFPGKFVLSYLPRNKVLHEYVTVTPDGFRYRKNTHRSLNSLFGWFKEHFRDPIPRTPKVATPITQTPQAMPDGTPINQAIIQKAAKSMPTSMFNTLSQVAGTPSLSSSNYFPQSTPNPSMMTPGYGINAQMATPRNYPTTPQQNPNWNSSMPPPSQLPLRQSSNLNMGQGRPRSRSGTDWSIQAESWTKKTPRSNFGSQPKTPLYATPGASSQMSISPNSSPNFANAKGDQTPLVDEWP